ncbi:SPFH domain-containing protein [Endozoicomonas atrinae]|uniref:SPFH domain-containing protein n=1 Tax=Endozoicomonas atrinae TaxID=1333660 RepID=UPI001112F797|nr:SPFH domain-containing protein [Endozoicomonas atrinae]
MENKLMTILLVFILFSPIFGGKTEASDFYSYIPFLYKIPEGSAGVFRNGSQFYDDVYPAGVYPTWPSDEGFVISILPEKAAVTDISCITAEGIQITFPKITVHYQVHEKDVLGLVKRYGIDFVKPVIKDPVKQGVAHLCGTMTAEAVYFDGFAMLKEYLDDFLIEEQRDKDFGISVCNLEIDSPRVPDVMIESHTGHNPDQEPQTPTTCEQPYEIFYTLEDEQEAINRLCDSGGQSDESYQDPASEGDAAIVLEPTGSVAGGELSGGFSLPEGAKTSGAETGYESSQDGRSIEWAVDPFIDGQNSGGDGTGSIENSRDSGSEPVGELSVSIEPVHSTDAVTGTNQNQPPAGLVDEVPGQERSKEKLYQQMQDSKGLWKNNNSRLYLGW